MMRRVFHPSLVTLLLGLPILFLVGESISAAPAPPSFPLPLGAPWPAEVVLVSGGYGYGYGPGPTHKNSDVYAMDFNGYQPYTQMDDLGLLVLAVADGCVKSVEYKAGYYNKEGLWVGNYGWTVVLSHDFGYQSRYAHLNKNLLIPSAMSYNPSQSCYFVPQGYPIGMIDGTGTENDSAKHLHFALYYCDPAQDPCVKQSVVPEPMDGVSPLGKTDKGVKVASNNFSVGFEKIEGEALKNPGKLKKHQPIIDIYHLYGGQIGLFGRAIGPVEQISGENIYYQLFAPSDRMSTITGVIVESGNQAYMLPTQAWELYEQDRARYGTPTASAYLTNQGSQDYGWRVEFQNASIFTRLTLPGVEVWDATTEWKAIFCPVANQFSCMGVKRYDPYIDFTFNDSNNTGPLRGSQGFSTIWEAELDGNLFKKVSLEYEVQGHLRLYIGGRAQSEWINSEDGVLQNITKPSWQPLDNKFVIRFWQAPGKPARLKIVVHETGLISPVHAFDSQGTLESIAYQAPEMKVANFEPPEYPGEPGAPEVPILSEPTPTSALSTLTAIPSIPPGDGTGWGEGIEDIEDQFANWFERIIANIQAEIDSWWQEILIKLNEGLEQAIIQILEDFLRSLEESCLGVYLLIGSTGIFMLASKSRR